MGNKLEDLKTKHNKLYMELMNVAQEYKTTENLLENTLIFFTEEEKKEIQGNWKKKIKTLDKKYSKIREEIYFIEDQIAEIDENVLNDIVKPMPEFIGDMS